MQIQIALPDDVAHSLKKKWGSLERKLLEMVVIEAYREGSISAGKVRELLGYVHSLRGRYVFESEGGRFTL